MCSVNQIKNYNLAKLKGEFLKRYVPLDPCREFILKKEMDTQRGADRVAHVIKMLFIIKKKKPNPTKTSASIEVGTINHKISLLTEK